MFTNRLKSGGAHLLAIFASLVMFVPVYLIAVNALKTKGEANAMNVGLPTSLNWENFTTVIVQGKLVISFFNSVLYAGSSTIIGTVIAAFAAFVLSRKRTRMNRFFYFFLIMGIALPINFFTLTTHDADDPSHQHTARDDHPLLGDEHSVRGLPYLRVHRIDSSRTGRGGDHRRRGAVAALLPDHSAAPQAGSGDSRRSSVFSACGTSFFSRCTT